MLFYNAEKAKTTYLMRFKRFQPHIEVYLSFEVTISIIEQLIQVLTIHWCRLIVTWRAGKQMFSKIYFYHFLLVFLMVSLIISTNSLHFPPGSRRVLQTTVCETLI